MDGLEVFVVLFHVVIAAHHQTDDGHAAGDRQVQCDEDPGAGLIEQQRKHGRSDSTTENTGDGVRE